jgi:hypothetical protein
MIIVFVRSTAFPIEDSTGISKISISSCSFQRQSFYLCTLNKEYEDLGTLGNHGFTDYELHEFEKIWKDSLTKLAVLLSRSNIFRHKAIPNFTDRSILSTSIYCCYLLFLFLIL